MFDHPPTKIDEEQKSNSSAQSKKEAKYGANVKDSIYDNNNKGDKSNEKVDFDVTSTTSSNKTGSFDDLPSARF